MMKRLLFKLFTLAAVLSTLQASAAMSSDTFGDQDITSSLQMTDGGGESNQFSSDMNHTLGALTDDAEYDFLYWNLKFVITSSTTVMCIGPATAPNGSWVIPNIANGYRVTEIGREAFLECYNLTGIILGDYVETIGSYAFYECSALKQVDLANVQTIQPCAFGECVALKSVKLPSSLTYLGHYAFGYSGLTSVSIPSTLLNFDRNPFYNCPWLTEINVSSNHPYYCSVDGVVFRKDMTRLIIYPAGKNNASYIIPESVTSLASHSFGYSKLHQVTLPSRVTQVPYLGFGYNESLTRITCLAQTPPTVETYGFTGTNDNAGIIVVVPRDCKSSYESADVWRDFPTIQEQNYDFEKDGIYYNITGENTVEVTFSNDEGGSYSGTVTIPETVEYADKEFTVTSIGWTAFYKCHNLTHVNLPSTLTRIGVYAFYDCYNLDNVTIPKSVTEIETYAFCLCSGENFTEVVIPENVTYVNYGAFYGCTNLEKVTIGGHVYVMGQDVFYSCPSLSKVICQANTPPTIQSTTFTSSHYSSVQLLVSPSSKSAYQAANYWKNFTNISTMHYDFEKDGVFYNILSIDPPTVTVTYMTSDYDSYSGDVIIPATVEHNGLTYTVTSIGSNAFRNSKGLTSVTLPNTITTINAYAFAHCEGLTGVVIPNSVRSIGSDAFWVCTKLTDVVVPNSVQTIGTDAFRNCSALKRIVIGKNVTSIGSTCFLYNFNLSEVICLSPTPPTVSNAQYFFSYYDSVTVRVPYDSHDAYRNATAWSQVAHIVSIKPVQQVTVGDVNADGEVNITDVTVLINCVLQDSAPENSAGADVNGDGEINITDVTLLIANVLGGDSGAGISSDNNKTVMVYYLIDGIPFTMVNVEGGTFMMGHEGVSVAMPIHQVTVSDYSIGETEVTQGLWQAVMGSNPSYFQSSIDLPVENMNWYDCQAFASKLSELTGMYFRLPTEAEWEFAARGGNKSQGYTYPGSNNVAEVAWYYNNSGNKTHVVATKAPNELGLYDMSGNVWEWCQDIWGSYTSASQVDPQGAASGDDRVCRSAAFNRTLSNWFECGGRTFDDPNIRYNDSGMRLACGANGEVSIYNDGNMVNDHLFVRMGDTDNEVTISETGTTRVAFWLDDDQIYTNTAVQALTPQAYNSNGDPYNEITYNSMQFDLYVPQNLEIDSNERAYFISGGVRMPSSAILYVGKIDETKVIEGVYYDRYVVLVYNSRNFGTHFSGSNPADYDQGGAMKKNDGPLFYIDFKRVPHMATPDGDQQIIIANMLFNIQETFGSEWTSSIKFIYGTGGNNASPRFQRYVRVKVKR